MRAASNQSTLKCETGVKQMMFNQSTKHQPSMLAKRQLAAVLTATALAWTVAPMSVFAQEKRDLVDTAAQAGGFKTLTKAIDAAGLTEVLKSGGPYTVFAPTDDAFAKLPAGELAKLMADKDKLATVLKGHVISGAIEAKDVKPGEVPTASGKTAKITNDGGVVSVDGAKVIRADIAASNGVIHVIDKVIVK
jgi:uncharacterized surface protein with fasciclin (FAS1) repeats